MNAYRLDVHAAAGGERLAEISDLLYLRCLRQVNQADSLAFALRGGHPAGPSLGHKCQLRLYRRNTALGLDWRLESVALLLGVQVSYAPGGAYQAVYSAAGLPWLLGTRLVAYPRGAAGRSAFSACPAETIAKTLVACNAGPAATPANGRFRPGAIPGLEVESDAGRGPALDFACDYDNLLAALQRLPAVGRGDFDLLDVSDPPGRAYRFCWYPGQRGCDRRSTVLFALERGNMACPAFTLDRQAEGSVAIVAGQGLQGGRQIVVRTGRDYAPGNDSEIFVNGLNETAPAALQARGDLYLQWRQARPELAFQVLQTPACAYGLHYALGDLVTARFAGQAYLQKVSRVELSLGPEGDQVRVTTTAQELP